MDKNMFFQLLRFSLGIDEEFSAVLTEQQWAGMYELSLKQTVLGVMFDGIERLPAGKCPPIEVAAQWYMDAQDIRAMNKAFDEEARRLTWMFAEAGHRSAILKGQANARLYPNPKSRQPGDIDIWVEGGEEAVIALLREKGLVSGDVKTFFHHVQLHDNNIEVEVHFRPTSCKSQAVQNYLNRQLSYVLLCPDGFYAPLPRFSLVMQLAHIRTHLFSKGVGLRQLIDYYFLLHSSQPEERRLVSEKLRSLGMYHAAAALMWVLKEVFSLDKSYMLVPPNERSGRWMLEEVLSKGNFGRRKEVKRLSSWRHFLRKKRRVWERILFEPHRTPEFLGKEWRYWLNLLTTIPQRVKYRTLSLKDHPKPKE